MLPSRGLFLTAFLTWTVVSAAVAGPVAAQQGTIAGTVRDAGTGQGPSQRAGVGAGVSAGSLTDQGGQFRFSLPAGTYTVVVEMIGYTTRRVEGVSVVAGQTVTVSTVLESSAIALDPIQVTVGRKTEKATEAPATVAIVSQVRIQERVAVSPIDHMKDVVGIGHHQLRRLRGERRGAGLQQHLLGAVHFLTDHRIASVPSLQVNLMQFVPAIDDDIARMEVVLGPGAALYGPKRRGSPDHPVAFGGVEHHAVRGGRRTLYVQGSVPHVAAGRRELRDQGVRVVFSRG